jgi:ABC-type sugar transport system ATPase subunit
MEGGLSCGGAGQHQKEYEIKMQRPWLGRSLAYRALVNTNYYHNEMSQANQQPVDAVAMIGIAKSFGGVAALEHVDFSVQKGEIHALLGGNGAGKSTILKMLSGVHKPDKGEIWINGIKLEEHTPEAARRLGIAMIFQEMSLVPSLSVAQNIFLTREPKGRPQQR